MGRTSFRIEVKFKSVTVVFMAFSNCPTQEPAAVRCEFIPEGTVAPSTRVIPTVRKGNGALIGQRRGCVKFMMIVKKQFY
ncbi:hypothetical protein TNCV_4833601 [Trichonephila clavipes]|nr:hypothetical protein TNCV_4833601 [Trichonephila clavipes]